VEVEFGYCRRPPLDEQREQIERFRRKVDGAAAVEQLPCRSVERECTESDAQNDLRIWPRSKRILVLS
jgi:hypothetical protein